MKNGTAKKDLQDDFKANSDKYVVSAGQELDYFFK
jgi:hypothetical protein